MYTIRKAIYEDCRGIAEVQVDSYRTAYAGLFPPAYLEHFTYEEQEQDWREWLETHTDELLIVAVSEDQRVMGYVLAKAQADIYPGYDAEVLALHVKRALQRQGVGSALLRNALEKLIENGCKSVMLWTLQGNPVRQWYESLQGQLISEKHFQVDDWDIVEVAYGWEQISQLMTTVDINLAYPRMETERLVLRALRMADADFIFKEWGDLVVTYYMRDEEPLRTREQAEEMLLPLQTPEKMPDFKWWGIELKESGHLIGTCGYCRWDKQHHRAEIGYDLWPDYWGQGIMPEALCALIQFGFEHMNLNRVEATTHTENLRSQHVLAKLGFQREGLLREYYYRDGIYNNQFQFSLLRKEWQWAG